MILGTLCAMIHGTAFPLMIIVFGEMTDLFVNSGKYEYVVNDLVNLGTLGKLNFTSEQVIKDPDLLE